MTDIFKNIKGDKAIWVVVVLFSMFSFLLVYSSSSNVVYLEGNVTVIGNLVKHIISLFFGFGIMYIIHKIPPHFFKSLSFTAILVVLFLLGFTLFQGTTTAGANASRWIRLPIIGFTFQTSNLAAVVLMIYVARYLAKIKDETITFKASILPLWLPVFTVLMLILPANFSTAAILFFMVLMLCFLGGYPFKYLLRIVGVGVVLLSIFVLVAKAVPDLMDDRVDTWFSRMESFWAPEDVQEGYQMEKVKMAIARGGLFGVGAGKSVMKNSLPHSSSDFIFAIIIEEYGLVGAIIFLMVYLFLLFRIVVVANGAESVFGKLLTVGVGFPIVFQAFVNMAVTVGLFPVTGQTLPLISRGGTSIWMTCLAIGIVLSVSNKSLRSKRSTSEYDKDNPLEILSGQL